MYIADIGYPVSLEPTDESIAVYDQIEESLTGLGGEKSDDEFDGRGFCEMAFTFKENNEDIVRGKLKSIFDHHDIKFLEKDESAVGAYLTYYKHEEDE